MNQNKIELYFLYVLIGVLSVLCFFIFKPFLPALILALVSATVCEPLRVRSAKIFPRSKIAAASLATFIIFIVMLVPLTLLGSQIFKETSALYFSIAENGQGPLLSDISSVLSRFNLGGGEDTAALLGSYAQNAIDWIFAHLGSLFSNVTNFGLSAFVFIVALFYIFIEGDMLRRALIKLSPLSNTHDETVLKKLTIAINSVVKGNLAVAVVQGILTAIGFAVFGVPNPTLWGSVTSVAALIPAFGTALVVVPGVIYLFAFKGTASAIGLLVWGVVAVGLVDNILGPKLVERGVKLHPFLILLSILGGISFFGILGFLFGPLVLSLFAALLEIHGSIRAEREVAQSSALLR